MKQMYDVSETTKKIIYISVVVFIIALIAGLLVATYFAIYPSCTPCTPCPAPPKATDNYFETLFPVMFNLTCTPAASNVDFCDIVVNIDGTSATGCSSAPSGGKLNIVWRTGMPSMKLLTISTTKLVKGVIKASTYITDPFVIVFNTGALTFYYPFNLYNNSNLSKVCLNIDTTLI